VLIDSTDADLLANERETPEEFRRFRQYCLQEALSSVTGLGRWTSSPVEAEINLRSTAQKSFMTESFHPRTLLAAVREHAGEPLRGQLYLASLAIPKLVLSASDNVNQQKQLADKLNADFEVVLNSSHRSIIGRNEYANITSKYIRQVATK
jgi:hypothetical protein